MLARCRKMLIQAPDHITEMPLRRRLQLLSALLLAVCALSLIAITLQLLILPDFFLTFVFVFAGLLCLLAAYGLARTGHFHWAARITVLVLTLICFAVIILNPTQGVAYAFLGLCLLFSSLLFSETGFVFTTALIILGVSVGLPAWGVPPPDGDRLATPIFLIISAALLYIYRRHMHSVERDQQAELISREAEFRAFFEQAAVGVAKIESGSGRFLRVNQRYCDITGYSMAEMCGLTFQDITPPEDLALDLGYMQKLIAGDIREYFIEKRHNKKNGGLVWVMLTVSPLWKPGATPDTIIAVVQDITDRKQAEQALSTIARGVSAATGENFFNSLVTHLAESLSADFAFVGELSPVSSGKIRTLAVHALGKPADNFEYAMRGTPCSRVFDTGPCAILREVQTLFPEDQMLVEMDAEAYVGVPLFDTSGAPLGLIAVLYRRPITQQAKIIATLNIFATRAVAELSRLRAEEVLRQSENKYRSIVENTHEGIWQIDADGVTVFANQRMAGMLGYTVEMMMGRPLFDFMDDEGKDIAEHNIERRRLGISEQHEFKFLRQDKEFVWAQLNTAPVFDSKDAYAGAIALVTDITGHRQADQRMRQLSSALEQTADSVVITDTQGIIEYVNPAFIQTTGYTQAEVLGQNPRLIKSGVHDRAYFQKLWKTIEGGKVYRGVMTNRRKDGSEYFEEKTITPLKDTKGRITHYISTGKDVTERMQSQQKIEHMSQHDTLTELPNRTLLLDRANQAIARARWHKRIVAVMFIDLDRFKTINDTLGHEVGDLLLQQLAARFIACVREGDTVARFGGDEFVILLDDVGNESDIRSMVTKVLDALAPTYEVGRHQLYISASIGVSLYPNDGRDATTLLKNADVAMYRAKELGKNTYQFYSADMSARAFQRLTLESSLRNALARGEFCLHYQPVIDLQSGCISSVEALIRWQHPDLGLVMPSDFISALEDTGLIVPVGEWVLMTACAQLDLWHQQGWPALRLAVNLSPRQFQNNDMLKSLRHVLSLLHCPPDQLELEITESMLMQQGGVTLQMLDDIHALGVRLAIDDFGTGYSSLGYLRRFPVDTLKIDRSFVRDIPGDADDCAITTAVTVLAQSLKLFVVAEGVENIAQRDFLLQLGCHLMQGYLFSKPIPAQAITQLLEAHNPCKVLNSGPARNK